jgi:hypothetical protein
MKSSDSTNSLTGLTEHIEVQMEENACFICLDEMNENGEPLVDSSMLRTCGCRFKVHPVCWNEWMKGKTDYDCPICRKKSLTTGKSPVPVLPPNEWQTERRSPFQSTLFYLVVVIFIVGGSVMIYEITKGD